MWVGVNAVSRTIVWCHAPSQFGQKLASMYSDRLVMPMRLHSTAMRRVSSAGSGCVPSISRPVLTSHPYQTPAMMAMVISSAQNRVR